jgi:hypothetical protein
MLVRNLLLSALLLLILASCQKEIAFSTTPVVTYQPQLGTRWTYRSYTYNLSGSLNSTVDEFYRISSIDTLGGEPWFNVTDSDANTVFHLKVRPDGLYQYTNNSSNLLCKDSAALGDSYTTYNNGGPEVFTVSGLKDTVDVGAVAVSTTFYTGVKNSYTVDYILYNKAYWFLEKDIRRFNPFTGTMVNVSKLELLAIAY